MSERGGSGVQQPSGFGALLCLQAGLVFGWSAIFLGMGHAAAEVLAMEAHESLAFRIVLVIGCVGASLLGGLLADRRMGPRNVMLSGMALATLGGGAILVDEPSALLAGALLLAVGASLSQPCLLVQLGNLYGPSDPRRDSGFGWVFVAERAGLYVALFVSRGGRAGLDAAALAMMAVTTVAFGAPQLFPAEDYTPGQPDAPRAELSRRDVRAVVTCVVALGGTALGGMLLVEALGGVTWLVQRGPLALLALLWVGLLFGAWRLPRVSEAQPLGRVERQRLMVLAALCGAAALCVLAVKVRCGWEEAELLADARKTEVGRVVIALVGLTLGGMLVRSWQRSRDVSRVRSGVAKVAVGVLVVAIGTAPLLGIDAPAGERVGILVMMSGLVGAVGELLVSSIGRAMVTKLAPVRCMTVCMAVFGAAPMLLSSVSPLGGVGVSEAGTASILVGLLLGGGALLLGLPTLTRWMHGAEEPAGMRKAGFVYRGDGRHVVASGGEGTLGLPGDVAGQKARAEEPTRRVKDPRETEAARCRWMMVRGVVYTLGGFALTAEMIRSANWHFAVVLVPVFLGSFTFLRGFAGWVMIRS
ncbi:hypothetical protein [Chondromyces crocatus]|uniref:MFS transporter n=1 Tax=Chondromyces crocatus TaxID=52 RepID=A0A0K1EAZ8_CHOCO|nr:hypothetical protein [Chondromyces crocatus]AKT37857.1 uncharacterized protein CMC5_020000 [Chondromyces crocatus]